MSLKGVFGKPYIDLDSLIKVKDFHLLTNEMIMGIAKSWIDKGVVSCGIHPDVTSLELCQVLKDPGQFLTPDQVHCLNQLSTLHQKAWYCTLLLPIHHPYSLVFLRREKSFWNKHLQDECSWTENAVYFPETIKFIKKLPFEQIGRVLFFISEPHQEVLTHYDGELAGNRDRSNTEMIYFRPLQKKKLFLYDEQRKQKIMIGSTASYWNDCDWHGALPTEGKAFSMRVDGIFSESFRNQIKAFSESNDDIFETK